MHGKVREATRFPSSKTASDSLPPPRARAPPSPRSCSIYSSLVRRSARPCPVPLLLERARRPAPTPSLAYTRAPAGNRSASSCHMIRTFKRSDWSDRTKNIGAVGASGTIRRSKSEQSRRKLIRRKLGPSPYKVGAVRRAGAIGPGRWKQVWTNSLEA